MAKISLNMMEKMMDPNIIDYYIINCAIPSIITIEDCYQINFGKPDYSLVPISPVCNLDWFSFLSVGLGRAGEWTEILSVTINDPAFRSQ